MVQVACNPSSSAEWKVFHFSDADLDYCLACPAVGDSFCCLTPECCGKVAQLEVSSQLWLRGPGNTGEFTCPDNIGNPWPG